MTCLPTLSLTHFPSLSLTLPPSLLLRMFRIWIGPPTLVASCLPPLGEPTPHHSPRLSSLISPLVYDPLVDPPRHSHLLYSPILYSPYYRINIREWIANRSFEGECRLTHETDTNSHSNHSHNNHNDDCQDDADDADNPFSDAASASASGGSVGRGLWSANDSNKNKDTDTIQMLVRVTHPSHPHLPGSLNQDNINATNSHSSAMRRAEMLR